MSVKHCYKCKGFGFLPEYSGIRGGICFRCNGRNTRGLTQEAETKQLNQVEQTVTIYHLENIINIGKGTKYFGHTSYSAYDQANECPVTIDHYENGNVYLEYGEEHSEWVIESGKLVGCEDVQFAREEVIT